MIATAALATLSLLNSSVDPGATPAPTGANYLLALAPEEAFSVVALGNLDALRAAANKNAWFQFARDEQMARLCEYFLSDALAGLEKELDLQKAFGADFDPREFVESLHGSAVVFSDLPSWNPDDMLIGVLLELGQNRSGFDDLLSRVLDQLGDDVVTEGSEYAGAALTTFRPVHASGVNAGSGAVLAELGDVVAIVGGADVELALDRVRGIVDRWAGLTETPGLLQNEQFASARVSAGFAPDVEGYVNLAAIWKALESTGQWGDEVPEELRRELGAIRWIHAGARFDAGEDVDLALAVSAPSDGLISAFSGLFGGIPVELLKAIPRHSIRVSTTSLDLNGLFAMATDLLRTFEPTAYEELESALEAGREMGIDAVGDVLANLTGAMATFTVEVPSNESVMGMAGDLMTALQGGQRGATYGSGWIIGLADSTRLERVIDDLVSKRIPVRPGEPHGAGLHTVEEISGYRIHTFGDPSFVAAYWCFLPQGLVVALQPTPIREALHMLEQGAASIVDKRRFAEVLEKNRRATFFGITDTSESMKSLLAGLKWSSTTLPFLAAMFGQALPDLPIGPETPWPSPTIVGRYFEGTTATAVTWDEKSLRIHLSSH